MTDPMPAHDERRYRLRADRQRCARQDNPLPRPAVDELLTEYACFPVPSIARRLGRNENTVRSWVNRGMTA